MSVAELEELMIIDVQKGEGKEAKIGSTIKVHYTGWVYDKEAFQGRGNKFDSSVDRDEPFEFHLGKGDVIQGWEGGFVDMKVGGKRTLVIPSDMAYGSRSVGSLIPAYSTLVFEVELLEVK